MVYRNAIAMVLLLTFFVSVQRIGQAQEPVGQPPQGIPLSSSPSVSYMPAVPMTIPQQRALFAAEQRMLRLEWNRWIGYSPLRPHMNASYMSNGVRTYFIPGRSVIVSAGRTPAWYW